MMSLMVDKTSEEQEIKENMIRKTIIRNENVHCDRFEKFLKMNTFDLALEDPHKAYEFLSQEVMKINRKNDKEKRETFKRILIEIAELLEINEYIKYAKTLLTHLKRLEDQDQDENEFITKEEARVAGSSEISNDGEKENDFDAWLEDKENRVLMNFAFSFCADGEQKKAKSFLREHIYLGKSEIIKSEREKILNEAMNYLNNLIKREIGTI